MTLDEFVEHAERYARDHHEPGTLSRRHLQRLISGHTPSSLRPANARLLEHLLGEPITALLAPPKPETTDHEADAAAELRHMLDTARRIDHATITLLHQQLDALRRLDRQLGARTVRDELTTKIHQVEQLTTHSLTPGTREPLAALLSEMHTLAGWQALDLGNLHNAWHHYQQAQAAAAQSNSPAHQAHAAAETAFLLIDAGATRDAVALLGHARKRAARRTPQVLQAWLAAGHGEALAVTAARTASLRAFDRAAQLLPNNAAGEKPYVALDSVHLTRWRGHALARLGDPAALAVLTEALAQLDASFVRAQTALRVDLARACVASGSPDEAQIHTRKATDLAAQVGSVRQQRRIEDLSQLFQGSVVQRRSPCAKLSSPLEFGASS